MKQERVVQQSVMSQLLLLSKPDPKALPDFIEIMVSGGRSFIKLVIPFKSEKEQESCFVRCFDAQTFHALLLAAPRLIVMPSNSKRPARVCKKLWPYSSLTRA